MRWQQPVEVRVEPFPVGRREGLSYYSVSALFEIAEGENGRCSNWYAYGNRSTHNAATLEWREKVLSREETVGLPWLSAWALAVVGKLRDHPPVVMVNPGRHHSRHRCLGHRFRALRQPTRYWRHSPGSMGRRWHPRTRVFAASLPCRGSIRWVEKPEVGFVPWLAICGGGKPSTRG